MMRRCPKSYYSVTAILNIDTTMHPPTDKEMPQVSIIIPTFNEGETLQLLLKEIKEKLENVLKNEIIVIDDGSSDATYVVAKEAGAKVIRHTERKGFGMSLMDGFRESSFSNLVVFDASGRYDPKSIITGLKPIIDDKADITVGVGHYDSGVTNLSRAILSFFFAFYYSLRLKDPLSEFICLKRKVLQNMVLYSNDFSVLFEILMRAKAQRCRIVDFSAETRKRLGTKSVSLREIFKFSPFQTYKTLIRNFGMGEE